MKGGTIHIVGAGLAGSSAAVEAVSDGRKVRVYEAAAQAGGRCRSYVDTALGMVIDNGNHLLLSGNTAAIRYLAAIGGRGEMQEWPPHYRFVDLSARERWTLRMNEGRAPWWLASAKRRAPGIGLAEYLQIGRLLRRNDGELRDVLACDGALYQRLLEPVLLAALNTEPSVGSAALARAVLRQTLAAGGRCCHPMIPRRGLSAAFVNPALRMIAARGGDVKFNQRLRSIRYSDDRVHALEFSAGVVDIEQGDSVVLAVPAHVAPTLAPVVAPSQWSAILNAHFAIEPPPGTAPFIGVVNGFVQWLFAFPGRISVTISAANGLDEIPREKLASRIWEDVRTVLGLACEQPRSRIIFEKRATFLATPAQDRKRPSAKTQFRNLALAGDWTQTGLPATIEGAIGSGVAAIGQLNAARSAKSERAPAEVTSTEFAGQASL